MIDFPASPNVGQQFSAAGVTWSWDGFKWTATGLNTPYLPSSGGTLTGPLTAPAITTPALSAPQAIGDNRIINGDMRIDQRNNGASGTANGYTVDRWQYSGGQPNKGSWQRGGGALSAAVGFPYALNFVSSSAYTPLAGDAFSFLQVIEADMISDFAWGTANAQPVTLSFWASSSLTGIFGGAITSMPSGRSYPFTYSIPAASTWTKIVVTIPGDTAGTWVMSGNAAGVRVIFDLGAGATFRGPAGAWAGTSYWGANGGTNVVAVNGASFGLTGVKLETGSVATPFNRQSLAKSMADCQRYYQSIGVMGMGGCATAASQIMTAGTSLLCTMRATPTTVFSGISYANASALTINTLSASSFTIIATAGAAGQANWQFTTALSAEL